MIKNTKESWEKVVKHFDEVVTKEDAKQKVIKTVPISAEVKELLIENILKAEEVLEMKKGFRAAESELETLTDELWATVHRENDFKKEHYRINARENVIEVLEE